MAQSIRSINIKFNEGKKACVSFRAKQFVTNDIESVREMIKGLPCVTQVDLTYQDVK